MNKRRNAAGRKPANTGAEPAQPDHVAPDWAVLLEQASKQYWDSQWALWRGLMSSGQHACTAPAVAVPEPDDRRFHGADWNGNAWYGALMQAYLLNARLLSEIVETTHLDAKAKHRLRFLTRQFIDATSPANFLATNPEATRLALESGGESLRAGLANLSGDLGRAQISITDEASFEVGRNIAVTAGAVIFESELIQLIQYSPTTSQVAARPLVIVPPCVNKFYVLDLQPANSFVRYACEQGYTVFVISWRNPDDDMRCVTWDDYLQQGVMQAIRIALAISGADKVNAVGWCVGGTMLASALAILRAHGHDPVASVTLLTTLLDFEEPGDLGAFVDERSVAQAESTIGTGGLYSGKTLAFVFQMLRANDLLWPYVADNYLKGKTPQAFDLLYWNSDATNLPGPMYTWLLRNTYLENNLRVPGRLTVCGAPLDLGAVDVPSYLIATQRDHLVPWRSAWRTTRLLGGHTQFVLSSSGHIAGVINPPGSSKRNYWTCDNHQAADPDDWFAHAESHTGSWWPHWNEWLRKHAGPTVNAPARPGNNEYEAIEPAPGRYVRVRLT